MHCRCEQQPLSCTPTDDYETVMTCDNSDGVVTAGCRYTKTIGTTFSEEVSESMSISASISVSMSASFFRRFSTTLETSVTTGYDWSEVSSSASSEEENYEVIFLISRIRKK